MLQTAARQLALSRLPVERTLAAVALGSFFWLLASDRIHPFAIVLLQAYLSF